MKIATGLYRQLKIKNLLINFDLIRSPSQLFFGLVIRLPTTVKDLTVRNSILISSHPLTISVNEIICSLLDEC